ncbi:hypothetical protein M3Y99_00711900 [Aphelenchoides fujianensis]|nr:hypothetical protein M3Y99_00711900 [Aphelenchoides fujianensis]
MINRIFLLVLVAACFVAINAVDPPPGLRPAKAVGGEEDDRKIVPLAHAADSPQAPPNVRTPPNLSLRSRMIAAQNSAAAASHDDENTHEEKDAFKQPVVFTKASKSKPTPANKAATSAPNGTAVKKAVIVPTSAEIKTPRVTGPPPPSGNYGVNTGLLTNLVDSQGRIIKGVQSVPIPLPPSGEVRNSKGQASSSVVGNDEDRIVPVKFGRAGDQ